jgi:hypothetical protein
MKWNRVDLTLQRTPTDADEEEWEERWRDIRSVAARFDKVSSLLTGKSFDSFLPVNGDLLKSVRTQYQSAGEALAKDFFVKGLFHKRNRIVHFGKIDFQKSEAELCFALANRPLANSRRDKCPLLSRAAIEIVVIQTPGFECNREIYQQLGRMSAPVAALGDGFAPTAPNFQPSLRARTTTRSRSRSRCSLDIPL